MSANNTIYMKLLDIANQRYSCRAYTSQPVDDELLNYIKECIRLAPSAVNKQPWRFYIVRSEEGKANLRKCYDREWFKTAPMYILATVLHDEEWVRGDGKHHGNIDIAIAVEHLCLSAAEEGLGTCWVCNFDAKMCSNLFHLNDTEEPAVIIPIGYPEGDVTPKKRKESSEVFVEA